MGCMSKRGEENAKKRKGGSEVESMKGKSGRERTGWNVFRNVAGLGNKDGEFWRGLREWDVMASRNIRRMRKDGGR